MDIKAKSYQNEKEFARIKEYASMRCISSKQVYLLLNKGLPHLRYGGAIVIDIAAADEWARRNANAKSYEAKS